MHCTKETLVTPVYGAYDVIVAGAGPAGCGAALSCARNGMKTLLIEKFNCLGGMWTTGYMNPFFDTKNKNGIVRELINELEKENHWGGFWDISFHYEYMKHILETKMLEAGVELLFNTSFTKTLVENRTVRGVVFENIEGRFACYAKYVIDCTGDGNVAADAGCAFEIGENGDYKQCQPMTLMFLVGNIPERYKKGLKLTEKLEAAYKKAGKEIPFKMPFLIPVPNAGFGVVQFTHMYGYNPLSASEITKATIEGRNQMLEAFEVLTKYDEEFKNLELISSAGVLGVRESRRIIGEYIVTREDLLSGTQFEDAVANVTFNVDMHTEDDNGQLCYGVKPYQIPFRALLPKGFDGIVTAGRCISGTHEAMASYRVTGNCCQMGENAGLIVSCAVKNNISVRAVKVNEIVVL